MSEERGQPKPAAGVPIRDFRDLFVWQKAIAYAKLIYEVSRAFPVDERFALTNQIRRAAVSVSSNVAEGHARQGREFVHFLSISRGSLAETQSQLFLAVELGFVPAERITPLLSLAGELHRMIASLVDKIAARHAGR